MSDLRQRQHAKDFVDQSIDPMDAQTAQYNQDTTAPSSALESFAHRQALYKTTVPKKKTKTTTSTTNINSLALPAQSLFPQLPEGLVDASIRTDPTSATQNKWRPTLGGTRGPKIQPPSESAI